MKRPFILLLLFFIQFVSSQELALVRKKGKFGFITKEGAFAIEPKFDAAKNFSDGLAAVKENGKWGFIDNTGTLVIPATFDNAKYFDSGICIIQKNTSWFYINKKGEILKGAPQSDKLFDFNNGVAFFRQAGKVGLINNKFEIVLAPKYDVIRAFQNGFARAAKNDQWGIIDPTGKEVVAVIYDEVGNYINNTTWAKDKKTYGIVHNGQFIAVEGASEMGEIGTQDLVAAKKNGKWGFVNLQGQWIIQPRFSKTKPFSKNLAPVCSNDKWGYINLTGKYVVAPAYTDAESFSEDGLAAVKEYGWGFINETGKLIIPTKYEISIALFGMFMHQEKGFIDGLARVKLSGKWGFLKPDGQILNEWYQNAEPFQK
ncbi:WG repeat-containing protein [Flavobacterium pectinovorum]|uniref:WG repeat-containing protein n=1 Tax=Flavobacterium pectinovorum TaxID=29533 RepID=UPI001FAC5DA3|nr:WG repeat-containing protein [Flavobacterium pectinovorum]MCI9846197.1 WG repeat-containing protein [Flavobacterium pectinovorum]